MTRTWLAVALFLAVSAAQAGAPCATLRGPQAFTPLSIGAGAVCFVEEPFGDEEGLAIGPGETRLAVYLVSKATKPSKAGDLPYMATTGKIEDAFVLDVDHDGDDDIVVVHSAQISSDTGTDTVGPFRTVLVFSPTKRTLVLNERASSWFGSGFDLAAEGTRPAYSFPYGTRAAISRSILSPLRKLITADQVLPATVVRRSSLHDGPVVQDWTRMYLVAGDEVLVDRSTAGWCHVTYDGRKGPVRKWLNCSDLHVTEMP